MKMNHLLLAYELLLIVLGVIALFLLYIKRESKDHLKPLFYFFLVYTLVIFLNLVRSYFLLNIEMTSAFWVYLSLGITTTLNFLYLFFAFQTAYRLFPGKSKKNEMVVGILLLISTIIMISPLSVAYIEASSSILIRRTFFLSKAVYLGLLIYMEYFIISGFKKIKKPEERILGIFFLTMATFGLFETVTSFIEEFKEPIQKINISSSGTGISSIAYLILGLYIIHFMQKKLTSNRSIPTHEKLKGLGYSPREIEVLYLVIKGYPNKKIADELCVSLSTIKTHISNILRKADASNRFELVKKLEVM